MKVLYILRFILLPLSVVFTLFCFINLSSTSLPYQDASQALLEKQKLQIDFWNTWFMISCCMTVLSAAFLFIMSVIKRKSSK